MRLIISEDESYIEDTVQINCAKLTQRLKHLANYIKQYSIVLDATIANEQYKLAMEDILYIDCTDGKTFLYASTQVYESKQSLTTLENILRDTPFLRISKNCILNTTYIKSVKPLANHRLEATLKNEEKVIIARTYIQTLKEKLTY